MLKWVTRGMISCVVWCLRTIRRFGTWIKLIWDLLKT